MTNIINGIITSIFPDDINTDDIIPAWTLQESTEKRFFGQFALANYDKDFIKRCSKEKNNIIIAGDNFGCGSSREQAIYALQENKIKAIIAKSFPDIFYRNALNNGLVLITLDNIKKFKIGDEVKIDLKAKVIILRDKSLKFEMNEIDATTFASGGKIERVRSFLIHTDTIRIITESKSKKSRGQTMAEKIISNHVHKIVYAGDYIENLPIDTLFFNEVIGPAAIKSFQLNFPKRRVFDPKKVFFIPDHTVPSCSVAVSEGITYMEEFAEKMNIKCYKEGDGIEHIVLMEDGHILPGSIVLGTDSHTDTNGALNCLAFGIGTTDASFAMATGHLYDFIVPSTIRINLTGKFQKGTYAKDLILYLIGKLGADGAVKKIVEFGGPALKNLSMDARTTVSNMAVEMGARTAIFESDEILEKYLKDKTSNKYKTYKPDRNARYDNVLKINLSALSAMVAFPHKPSNVTPISDINKYMKKSRKSKSADLAKVSTIKITDAFLGACTNGKYEDFLEASKILKGKKVHKDVNFTAIPASRKIYNRLLKEGILQIFAQAGANIESSNCGPCFGKHMGVIGKEAQMISSSNRNYIGRMGSKEAKIFLASPATVAACAITGEITDPRKFL